MTKPVLIDPEALYDDRTLRRDLGLSQSSLDKARRTGEIRFARRGKRVLYRGAWVLAWLEADAPTTPPPCPPTSDAPRQGVAS